MKTMKKLAAVCMAVMFAFGLGAFAACNKESSSESSGAGESLTSYKFIVLNADETPVANQMLLLCEDENCLPPVYTNEDGIAYYSVPNAGAYAIHIVAPDSSYMEYNGPEFTPTEYSEITLTLKN